jgi:hypothetical protein
VADCDDARRLERVLDPAKQHRRLSQRNEHVQHRSLHWNGAPKSHGNRARHERECNGGLSR